MKIDDLVMLIKAGYTKQDIDAMGIAGPEHPAEQKPEQPAEQKPEQPAEQKPEQPAEKKPEQDKMKEFETKLDYVVNRLNYLAVQGSRQPDNKEQSVDDILSSVIRGNDKKGDK